MTISLSEPVWTFRGFKYWWQVIDSRKVFMLFIFLTILLFHQKMNQLIDQVVGWDHYLILALCACITTCQVKQLLLRAWLLVKYETLVDNTNLTNIMHNLAQKCGSLVTMSMQCVTYMKVTNMKKVGSLLVWYRVWCPLFDGNEEVVW